MDAFRIIGGTPLSGAVEVSGAKNSALPIMAATILADRPVTLENVPELLDVRTLARVLTGLGVASRRDSPGRLTLQTIDATRNRASRALVSRMRASFCVLGPLLARRGRAIVPLPGGCLIGDRPVDLHLTGLAALGADIRLHNGCVHATAKKLRGAVIDLAGPYGPTVTGTSNVLSAAVLARGTTVIHGAATEPEIVDLGQFLIQLGARISGLGTSTIEIHGVEQLTGATYRIIPDRIEAITLLAAGVISGGAVTVQGVRRDHLKAVLDVLADMGVQLDIAKYSITASVRGRLQGVDVIARPYPGVPTDVQSQLTALATVATGRSRIVDQVFPERFHHLPELQRMGAEIARHGNAAEINGVRRLRGAVTTATDLRASAALVLAGLAAEGVTIVKRIGHLDRGYERLEEKLHRLGAQVERIRIPGHAHQALDREAADQLRPLALAG